MPSTEELLKRHKPVLKYDSQEVYFADSAAEWTDNPGNVLLDASGRTVAVAGEGLDLALLATACKDGTATDNDVIGDPARDYQEQARRLHAQDQYRNRAYGRAVVEGDVVWLQYWFFYFYNDYNLIGTVLKAGLHEGDWGPRDQRRVVSPARRAEHPPPPPPHNRPQPATSAGSASRVGRSRSSD